MGAFKNLQRLKRSFPKFKKRRIFKQFRASVSHLVFPLDQIGDYYSKLPKTKTFSRKQLLQALLVPECSQCNQRRHPKMSKCLYAFLRPLQYRNYCNAQRLSVQPKLIDLPVPEVQSHVQKVKSLYKRALRELHAWYVIRHVVRYHSALMRARFERHREVSDVRVARALLVAGEEELFRDRNWSPLKFTESHGGVAYERVVEPPDWVLDYWHPLEKARYPEYFKRREERKREFVQMWRNRYEVKYFP